MFRYNQPIHKDFTTCIVCGCHHEGQFRVLKGELYYESACPECVGMLSKAQESISKARHVQLPSEPDK